MLVEYVLPRSNLSFRLAVDGIEMVLIGVELPSPAIKYVAAFIYLLLSLSGIVMNMVWALVLFVGHRHFSQSPFYIVARHCLIADFLCALAHFATSAPLAFMAYKSALSFRRSPWFNYFSTLLTVGRFSTLIFVSLQVLSQLFMLLFNRNKFAYQLSASGSLICMFGWISCIGLMIWFLHTKCRNDYSVHLLHFFYDCSADPEAAQHMWTKLSIVTVCFLITGTFVYGIGFRTIRRSLNVTKVFSSMEPTEKKEFGELKRFRLVLCQGILVVVMEAIRVLSFTLVPGVSVELPLNLQAFISVVANCVEMLSTIVHPLVYITFNERAQKYLKKIVILTFCRKIDGNHASIMTDGNTVIGEMSRN